MCVWHLPRRGCVSGAMMKAPDTRLEPLAPDTHLVPCTQWGRVHVQHLHTTGMSGANQGISLEGLQVLQTLGTAIWGPHQSLEGQSTLGVQPPPQYLQPSGEQTQGVQYPLTQG